MAADDLPLPPDGLTYYQLLGVEEDAPEGDIERAYRQLVRHYHPDHFDHWSASDITKRLRQARDILTDPRARQRYDQEGHVQYTGEDPPQRSDVEEWVNGIQPLVDVDHQLSIDDIDFDEPGADEVAAAFDLSEIDVDEDTDDTIFEAEDDDTPSTADWGDVQEETTDEQNTDPGYVSEPDIGDIDPDPPPVEDEEREPVELSHEERIKQKAESRSRTIDPEDINRQQNETTNTVQQETQRTSSVDTVVEAGQNVYGTGQTLYGYLQTHLADDVLSRAHRKAWRTRLVMVVITFFAGIGVGEIADAVGVTVLARVFPRAGTILASPSESINIILTAVLVVFIADQLKTERDTSRGRINVAGPPLARVGVSIGVNLCGVLLAAVAINNGFHPVRIGTGLLTGAFPQNVWLAVGNGTLSTVVNTSIAVIMLAGLLVGCAASFHAVSRLVWYDRYCAGYHVLPAIWDIALVTPVVIAFWLFVTSAQTFGLPASVTEWALTQNPVFMEAYGIHHGFAAQGAVVLTALVTPALLGVAYVVRRLIETGGHHLYTELTN